MAKEKVRLWDRLKYKYKLSVINETSYEEVFNFRLSQLHVLTALSGATLTSVSTSEISYNGIVDAVAKFEEEQEGVVKYLFISPAQEATLRKDPNFIDKNKYGNDVMASGVIGKIAGCNVVVSRKIVEDAGNFNNYIVQVTPEPEDGVPSLPSPLKN